MIFFPPSLTPCPPVSVCISDALGERSFPSAPRCSFRNIFSQGFRGCPTPTVKDLFLAERRLTPPPLSLRIMTLGTASGPFVSVFCPSGPSPSPRFPAFFLALSFNRPAFWCMACYGWGPLSQSLPPEHLPFLGFLSPPLTLAQ